MKEVITPAMARNMLRRNNCNRPYNTKWASFLASQMEAGLWVYNGQPVIVASNGELADGQHRLGAIIECGLDLTTEVVRGIDFQLAFPTIDSGKVRSAGDTLAINGGTNNNVKAAAIRQLYFYDNVTDKSEYIFLNDRVANQDVLSKSNEVDAYLPKHDFIELWGHIKTYGGSTTDLFVAFVLYRSSPPLTMAFFERLGLGLFSNADDPCKRYREYLVKSTHDKKDAKNKTRRASLLFKTWNMYIKGSTTKRVYFNPKVVIPNLNSINFVEKLSA